MGCPGAPPVAALRLWFPAGPQDARRQGPHAAILAGSSPYNDAFVPSQRMVSLQSSIFAGKIASPVKRYSMRSTA